MASVNGADFWFLRSIHSCRPPPVISQEEVQEEKARLKAIDARPIKKVAEAKARKQKRAAVISSLQHCMLHQLIAACFSRIMVLVQYMTEAAVGKDYRLLTK